jgi:UDP-N-acetyl-D-mannosaminuronate dehydrogenase
MTYAKIVIIGGGSVGQGIYNYLFEKLSTTEIAIHDPLKNLNTSLSDADVVHVTVPYLNDDQYYSMWKTYRTQFKPNAIIVIHSTMNPLLIEKLAEPNIALFYVPIRTPEATMEYLVCRHTWLFAPINTKAIVLINYLTDLKISWRHFESAKALAFGKLLETTWSAMQIAYAQMVQRICKKYNMDFCEAYQRYMEFSTISPDQINDVGIRIPRPIFYPGKIGGKCLMQNLKIVDDNNLADLNFIEFIMDSNDKVKINE